MEAAMNHVLIGTALLLGYAVFLLIKPDKKCRSCGGWGARGKKRAYCTRCKGTGRRFRAGARFVHRSVVEGYRYLWRRRKERESH
jgi:hypothetical protein